MEEDKKLEEAENKALEEDTKKDSPKDTKKLLIIIGLIVGCFIIFFLVRYIHSPTGSVITIDELHQMNIDGELDEEAGYMYNGYSFVNQKGLWYTQVQDSDGTLYDIPLHFGPKELEEIPVIGSLDNSFFKSNVYVTFDPSSEDMQFIALSAAELSLNLIKGLGTVPIAACDKNETDACSNRPIITCESGEAAVYLKQVNVAMVKLDRNCATLQGEGYGLVKAVDRFILMQYGIMER